MNVPTHLRGMSFARCPRCLQRLNTKAKQAIKVPIKVFLRKEHFMTRINVLASVLYRKSVSLKNKNFNKLIWNNNRNEFVSSLSAMQFLVACIGLKNISHSQAEEIISVLHVAYDYKTEEFSDLLREASDESDYSDEYEDVIFQMHLILSMCINSIVKKEKGYILTNNHVARGGSFYSVRIEEDDNVYRTDEIIKYNPVIDLAVIRIDRRLKPIPIYSGKKPVRGQKVVAIGSPLGLFNSVSDGIISGFRLIDNVEMIQFTAPISHGSSGGALLNMNGEVIGISTAGFDAGQNLNLAVSYEYINTFLMGLKN